MVHQLTHKRAVDAYIKNINAGSEASWRTRLRDAEERVRGIASAGEDCSRILVAMKNLPAGGSISWSILNGAGDPWYDMDRIEAYSALWYTFCDRRKVTSPDDITQNTYVALASDRSDRVATLAAIGRLRVDDGRPPWRKKTDSRPAGIFAVWLSNRRAQHDAGIPVGAPFSALISDWPGNPDLDVIADYHLASLSGNSLEFSGVYSLLPVELDAVRKVRELEGLPTSWPSTHPLVTNALARAYAERPASTFDPKNDELFALAVDALTRDESLAASVDPWSI
ncbi:MAG: hypothetical protein JWP97_6185 [Labilithrix sp.]|nr:hypothetical protein [Labilithrix sp.]